MSNVVRFPIDRRVPVTTIPRAEFERLAELALDVVEQIITLLDEQDGYLDTEDGGDAEPSLGTPEGHASQAPWFRGGDSDGEVEGCPRHS